LKGEAGKTVASFAMDEQLLQLTRQHGRPTLTGAGATKANRNVEAAFEAACAGRAAATSDEAVPGTRPADF
jgi:hypothetical protein